MDELTTTSRSFVSTDCLVFWQDVAAPGLSVIHPPTHPLTYHYIQVIGEHRLPRLLARGGGAWSVGPHEGDFEWPGPALGAVGDPELVFMHITYR